MKSCPDTGSEICLLAASIARQMGATITYLANAKVWTANGQGMIIDGTADILVKIEDATKMS